MHKHPTTEQLKAYAVGLAHEVEFADLEQHLLDCRACLQLMEQLSGNSFIQKVQRSEDSKTPLNGEESPVTPAPLKLSAGYEIQEELGRGGMGIVYRAWQPGLSRYVAFKRLLNADLASHKIRQRFRNEATVLATIHHPCIVEVYDVGEQDGQPYIAMELVDGVTLSEQLREKVLDSRSAAQILVQLADAVAAANELGIIHRDLKPQNVLVTTAPGRTPDTEDPGRGNKLSTAVGSDSNNTDALAVDSKFSKDNPDTRIQHEILIPKLVDFGLSHLHREGKPITESAELLGTPGYMAPEQLRPDSPVTQLADVYGLGSILYQCLTGRAPFQGATAVETIAMVLSSDILPIGKLRRDVPRDLQVICHHCLEKTPNHRYASAAGLRDDLRRFLEGRPIQAKPPSFARQLVLWTRRNKAVAGLSLAILAGIVFGGVVIASYQSRLRMERDQAKLRYANARSTIWKMIDFASSQSIFEVPKLQELVMAQSRESMALFEQLAEEEGSEQATIDLARLRMLVGTIAIAQGDPAEGEELLKKATGAIASLKFHENESEELMKMAIAGQVKLATSLYGQGKVQAALEILNPAKHYAQALVHQNANSSDNLNQLAWVHHVLGSARIGVANFAEAKEDFQLAVELREKAFKTDGRNVELAIFLAGSLVNLALCEDSLGGDQASLANYQHAIEILMAAQQLDPQSSGIAVVAAGARLNASNLLVAQGQNKEAVDLLTNGIQQLQPFLDTAPEDFQFRENMFKLVGNRAMYSDFESNPEQVISDWKLAIELASREEDRQFCRDQLALRTDSAGEMTDGKEAADSDK